MRFTARERRRRLTKTDVAEPDLEQQIYFRSNRGHRLEEIARDFDRHLQYFGDILAAILHVERFSVVALTVTDVAFDVHVRQEVHLYLDHAVALARLAAPALDVERETTGFVAALAGLRCLREEIANRRE